MEEKKNEEKIIHVNHKKNTHSSFVSFISCGSIIYANDNGSHNGKWYLWYDDICVKCKTFDERADFFIRLIRKNAPHIFKSVVPHLFESSRWFLICLSQVGVSSFFDFFFHYQKVVNSCAMITSNNSNDFDINEVPFLNPK